MIDSDEERRTKARKDLASELSNALQFALATGMISEATLIAKLIEAVLSNTTNALILNLN